VKRALRPQGRFVISGLRADAVKDLDLAVLAQGFDVVDVTVDEEWCCLVYANVGPPLQVSVEALQSAAG
jgi:ribosomal protein L11 methylase PrmA